MIRQYGSGSRNGSIRDRERREDNIETLVKHHIIVDGVLLSYKVNLHLQTAATVLNCGALVMPRARTRQLRQNWVESVRASECYSHPQKRGRHGDEL